MYLPVALELGVESLVWLGRRVVLDVLIETLSSAAIGNESGWVPSTKPLPCVAEFTSVNTQTNQPSIFRVLKFKSNTNL